MYYGEMTLSGWPRWTAASQRFISSRACLRARISSLQPTSWQPFAENAERHSARFSRQKCPGRRANAGLSNFVRLFLLVTRRSMRLRGGRRIAGRKAFVAGFVDQPFLMGRVRGTAVRRQFGALRFRRGGFFVLRHGAAPVLA